MSYLYYTIYIFYKKIIKIESWGDKPFFYCNIVLALFQTFFLFTLVNLYLLYFRNENRIDYSELWPFAVGIGLFFLNRAYFKSRKENLLKEISLKSKTTKNAIVVISVAVMILILKIYFFTGDLIKNANLT